MHHSPIESTVRTTLARYLDVSAESLRPSALLQEDLELTTLDLVLVVLHVEELEGEEYDMQLLADVHTVGELVRFFRRQQHALRRISA